MTNTKRISTRDAEELVNGSAPSARPELAPLAALLEDYRTAATESHITPSESLMLRLDFTHSPMVLQPQVAASEGSGAALRRAGSGLLGIGVAAAIVMGAASGAAALVGSAGMLPPAAQSAFDQLVSVLVPTEGAADGPADEEAPGDTLPDTGATPAPTETPEPESTEDAVPPVVVVDPPVSTPAEAPAPVVPDPAPSPSSSNHDDEDEDEDSDEEHENRGDNGNHGNGNNGSNGNHGNGHNGNGNGGKSDDD